MSSQLRQWVIYKITSPNGRIYIGKTYSIENRIRQYKNRSHKNQPCIYRSISKYGFAAHSFESIDSFFSTASHADDKEMFWIRSYMSNISKYPEQNGLNLTDGADGGIGKSHTEEWKKQNSERHKGNTYNLGRKITAEIRKKMSNAHKGRVKSKEHIAKVTAKTVERCGIPILYLSDNNEILSEFPTMVDAAKKLGIGRGKVSAIVHGVNKIFRGKHFNLKLKSSTQCH